MASIANLFVELSLRAEGFNSDLRKAQREMKEFEKTIAPSVKALDAVGKTATAAGAAISAMGAVFVLGAKNAIDNADAMKKMSDRTGATVEALSALKVQADLADISMSELEAAFRQGSKTIENAASGSKSAADSLAKIGLSVDQLLKMAPDERFFAIAQGIAAIEDPSIKAGVAMEIWGKGGTQMLTVVDKLGVGLEATKAEAAAMGQLLTGEGAASAERFNDAITMLGQTITGLFNVIANSGLLNSISSLIEIVARSVGAFAQAHPWIAMVGIALGAMAAIVGPLLVLVGLMATGIAAAIPIFAAAATAIGTIGAPIIATVAVIGSLIAIFAAAAAGVIAFIASNEELRAIVVAVWEQIRAAAFEVWTEIQALMATVSASFGETWTEMGPAIQAALQVVIGFVGDGIKALAAVITTTLKVVSGIIQAFHGLVTGDATKFSAGIQKIWSALWNAIKAVVSGAISAIKNQIVGWTNNVTNAFKAMYDAVVGHSFVPDMMEGIRDAFGTLDGIMVDPTRRATSGVLSSFRGMFDTVMGFSRDWKGSLKGMFNDFLGGLNLREILKGDFGSVMDSLKGVIGIGGGGGRGGIGGIFSGGTGGAAGVGASSLLSSLGGLGGITSALGMVGGLIGKIGAGREAADQIVKSQNALVASTGGILSDSSLSATNKLKIFDNLFANFQSNAAAFAGNDPNNQKVVNQAFSTLAPWATGIRTDLVKQGAVDGMGGGGGHTFNITINAPYGTADSIAAAMWDVVNRNLGGFTEETVRQVNIKQGSVVNV